MGIGWERKMRIVASRMGLAGVLAVIIISVKLSEGFVVSVVRPASGRWATRGVERARAVSLRKPANIGMQMHRVTIEHEGKSTVLEVSERTTILEAALDNGIELPHDCKLGVCLTCPSKIMSGEIDQSDGTLDDSVVQQGFALTCCSYPKSDVVIRSIDEDELVGAQFSDRST